jgi:glycosyltransferase involved in cell wall biosynthesis
MRVLFVSCDPLEGAVTRYRCTHLAEALKSSGHTADVATIYDLVIRLEHDIVVLHRICANKEGQALADAVRKSGATLIYGADDLVFEEGLQLAMLRQADGVLVSTEALAKFATEVGARSVEVVRNWNTSLELCYASMRSKLAPVEILFSAGTRTHDRNLDLILPVIRKVLNSRPHAKLILLGKIRYDWRFWGVKHFVMLPGGWDNYHFFTHQCDIAIAPLEKTRFNSCKSELKWLEAGCHLNPCLASRWGGFAEVVRDGEDGFLADSMEEWEEKLSRLIDDIDLRQYIGKLADKRVHDQAESEAAKCVVVFSKWISNQSVGMEVVNNVKGYRKGKLKKILRRLIW